MALRVRDLLFDEPDLLKGFDHSSYALDLQGWNSNIPIPTEWNADLVVEVGTWKGGSAIKWAERFPSAEIVCIDTWTGAPEMWIDRKDPTRHQSLKIKNGFPTLYWQFLANVAKCGKQNITPVPLPSEVALEVLRRLKVSPDIIYLDGSHEYHSVHRDITQALLLKPKIICGDDFGNRCWPGVERAVREFFPHPNVNGPFWWHPLRS